MTSATPPNGSTPTTIGRDERSRSGSAGVVGGPTTCSHECLPLLLAWTGKSMRTLLVEDLDRFEARTARQPGGLGLLPSGLPGPAVRTAAAAVRGPHHRHPADPAADRRQLRRTARADRGAGDRPGDAALSASPVGGAAALDGVEPVRRAGGVRGVPRRAPSRRHVAAAARPRPHRRVPGRERHPPLARSAGP